MAGLSRIEAERDAADSLATSRGPAPDRVRRNAGTWAERLDELVVAEREDGRDASDELDGLLREMELEMFFGKLVRKLGRAGKSLVKQGLAAAASSVPALAVVRGVTDLARGQLRSGIARLVRAGAKAAIAGAAPWATPAIAAVSAVRRHAPALAAPAATRGYEPPAAQVDCDDPTEDGRLDAEDVGELGGDGERPDSQQIVDVAERAYEILAETLAPHAATATGAHRIATRALRGALAERRGRRCSCRGRRR